MGGASQSTVGAGDLGDAVRQALDLADQLGEPRRLQRAAQLGEAQAEEVEDGHLADEGLGGGHPDLQARAGEQHPVGVARGL